MSEKTNIEWCDSTFNPWIGCTKVSPACDHCYAERSTPARALGVNWGPGAPRHRTSVANWSLPKRWDAQHQAFFNLHGRRQRVFCASLADVFDNQVDPQWRADLFELIEATPNLDWLILTKRIGNAALMITNALLKMPDLKSRDGQQWPWPNVWLGATITSQVEADRDIPKLMEVCAAKRFLSMEPLLGPVDLTRVDLGEDDGQDMGGWDHCDGYPVWLNALNGEAFSAERHGQELKGTELSFRMDRLDWVIVGGESGPNARPMHPDWVRSLRDQCAAAGIPFMFKQWGEWAPDCLCDRLTGCAETPRPEPGKMGCMFRCGKKAAGRLLDGCEWNGALA